MALPEPKCCLNLDHYECAKVPDSQCGHSNASPIDRGRGFCVHKVSLNWHCNECERERAAGIET